MTYAVIGQCGLPISGEILLSHLRSIDMLARPLRPIGAAVPASVAAEVRAKLAALIAILGAATRRSPS
jgi:mRNA interferase MazF